MSLKRRESAFLVSAHQRLACSPARTRTCGSSMIRQTTLNKGTLFLRPEFLNCGMKSKTIDTMMHLL